MKLGHRWKVFLKASTALIEFLVIFQNRLLLAMMDFGMTMEAQ
jgi:hypothetical protein